MKHECQRIHTAIVKAGWLIDGTGRPAISDTRLWINNGMIEAVETGPAAAFGGDADGTAVLDLSEYTLMPALIDSHVHLVMSGNPDEAVRRHQPAGKFEDASTVIARHIEESMRYGVMAVRDGGDGNGHVTQYSDHQMAGHDGRFVLKTANRGWYRPGRYGRIVGGRPLSDDKDLESIGREMGAVDQVKIVNSGLNSLKSFGRQTPSQFTCEELTAIVAMAAKAEKPVMVHVNGESPVADAVKAGVDSIEHGYFMGSSNLQRMADAGVFWVPTVAPMYAYARLGGEGSDVAGRNMDHQLEQLRVARRAGVKVALGTDAGSPGVDHGAGVGLEMSLLLRAGYTIEEVVQAATLHGAELLRLSHRGQLAPGRTALVTAVKGPPGTVPANLGESFVYAGSS
ncbi:MAG: amidohydrolase family protein [Thermodesulfobacteriota bacterium]|nr:amidohydrolase family protein [Thermodesulfobacteriota bacterium]